MAVRVQLLGRFGLTSPTGEPLAVPPKKGQALVAVLALAGGAPVNRERLMALLWSDRGETQARGSLRQALTALRRAFDGIEPPPLIIETDHLALDPNAAEVDVSAFAALADSAAAGDLEQAAALYRGDLLDGLQVRDPAFEDWLEEERRGLRGRLGEVLRRLLALQADAGQDKPAVVTAERLLALDPLDEATHRALMRLYVRTGARNRALGQYKLCRETLERELGVAPEPATEQLYAEIAGGRTTVEETTAPVPAAADAGALPLPDKPSIAVLPFENLSGDPEQEYFADALSDEITTALARFRDLFVISRFSSFLYKGRSAKVRDIGSELGVAYVLEGSVQKSAGRVRINVQLVEAASGNQLWSERYDRQFDDIFALQDEAVGTIVSTLAGRLKVIGHERAARKSAHDLDTYDLVLRAEHCLHQGAKEDVLQSRALLEQAIERDPGSARAHASLALNYMAELYADWATAPQRAGERALALARRAVALDDLDSHAHVVLAEAHLYANADFEPAEVELEKALELNPNSYETFCNKTWLLALTGRADEGIVCADQALRLNPFAAYDCRMGQFAAAYSARRYDDAAAALRSISDPGNEVNACLAACYAKQGRDCEARQAMTEFLSTACEEIADYPGQDRERWRRYWTRQFPFKDPADLDRLLDGLRSAGLPDAPPDPGAEQSGKPTLAVLPFENLSGDPEQAYFADGITEDIITALSRFRDIAVIARTSSFAFKGQAMPVAEIAEKLGVQYIVEGSVRRAGERARITAQLIDAESGAHKWGQNYDRELADIFEVQDEVTRTVVATLAGRISDAGVERARRKPTDNLTAFDYLLQARDLIYHYSRTENAEAQELLKKAIALDPGYAQAHSWLAETYLMDWHSVWSESGERGQDLAVEIIAGALKLDDTDPEVHLQAASTCHYLQQYDQARHHIDRARVLNPNQPDLAMIESFHAGFTGDHAGALAKIQEAMRLDPFGRYGIPLGKAYYGLGQFEESLAAFRGVRARLTVVIAWLAACHAQLGQDADARKEAARFVEVSSADLSEAGTPPPESWLDFLAARNPYQRPEDLEHFLEGLRKAGLE
jgi:TolB-like protein/Flp pilus assembly protein TadD